MSVLRYYSLYKNQCMSAFENPFRSILIDMRNSSICGTVQPCSCSSPSSLSMHAVHAARAPAFCRRAWHAAQSSVKCFRMSTSLLQSMTCGAPRRVSFVISQASQKRKHVRYYRPVEVQHDQVLVLAHLAAPTEKESGQKREGFVYWMRTRSKRNLVKNFATRLVFGSLLDLPRFRVRIE
jgi:hypothetical protein